ncbi:hypothetical protein V1264_024173 [Littorina saxatilis]|uniref:Uncharacterized protein n=1 Tax=Littorina saxatilis TaxID=31220 RepID=A0AAN9AMF4_9CAEN
MCDCGCCCCCCTGIQARPHTDESKQGPTYQVQLQSTLSNGTQSNTPAEDNSGDDKRESMKDDDDDDKTDGPSNTTVACSRVNQFCDRIVCCQNLTCTYNEVVKYKLCT